MKNPYYRDTENPIDPSWIIRSSTLHKMEELDWKNHWIELNPLSSISYEDAIEVAKIEGYNSIKKTKDRGFFKLFPTNRHLNFISDPIGIDSGDKKLHLNSYSIDLLRSRGYALPWMGLSVEELVVARWIKLIENQ